jgi:hypothetical protein
MTRLNFSDAELEHLLSDIESAINKAAMAMIYAPLLGDSLAHTYACSCRGRGTISC